MMAHSPHCASRRVGMEVACNCTLEPLPPAWVNQRTVKIHEMPAPYATSDRRRSVAWVWPASIVFLAALWSVLFALAAS